MSGEIVLGLRILAAAALYGFLAWGLSVLWRDLHHQGALARTREIPAISLDLEHHELKQILRFTTAEVILGRDPACDFHIPNDTVSARHARLKYHHNQWWAEDLNSTNGTFLNDEPLDTPTVIVSGDDIRCGQVDILIQIGGAGEKEERTETGTSQQDASEQ